jgi:hypothetical protein
VSAGSIVDQHEIVPGAVHFRKPKHYRSLTYAQLLSKRDIGETLRRQFGKSRSWRLLREIRILRRTGFDDAVQRRRSDPGINDLASRSGFEQGNVRLLKAVCELRKNRIHLHPGENTLSL